MDLGRVQKDILYLRSRGHWPELWVQNEGRRLTPLEDAPLKIEAPLDPLPLLGAMDLQEKSMRSKKKIGL